MDRKTLNTAGLTAIALLAPGGIILGGLLAYRAYRRRAATTSKVGEMPET